MSGNCSSVVRHRQSGCTAYNQSINQSKHISIAPYVASESEAHTGRRLSLRQQVFDLRWKIAGLPFTSVQHCRSEGAEQPSAYEWVVRE